jgi:hypothetical protein
MAQFTVVGTYQHFGGNYFLHFQGRWRQMDSPKRF